jgi:hypothetical protein
VKRAIITAAMVLSPAIAHAEESRLTVTPMAGVTFGEWLGIPVTRGMGGVELTHGKDVIRGAGHALIESGRTEYGLGSHRLELGGGISTPPWWLRAGAGVHLAYAMLVRVTDPTRPFGAALGGDIGGFGLGLHANVELAVPISTVAVTLGGRGALELYDGGPAAQATALLGVRF